MGEDPKVTVHGPTLPPSLSLHVDTGFAWGDAGNRKISQKREVRGYYLVFPKIGGKLLVAQRRMLMICKCNIKCHF